MRQDDLKLVHGHRNGDPGAFATLYDAYCRGIYDYLYYRCHHRETAEDLASQTFMKALERIGTFDPEKGPFSAWLYRIAHNALVDHFRALRPTEDIEDVWDALASGEDVARDAETRERLQAVERALRGMPGHKREIIILRLWDELSFAEIGAILGKSEAACKMDFSRTVRALRDSLPLAAFVALFTYPLFH